MPDLKPFRGIRFARTEELRDLVCPPYDVISPEEQRRLHARHPHNAVRVELPFSQRPDEAEEERYRRAGRQFQRWLEQRVLVQDATSALFVYRQDLRTAGGAPRKVVGVIGALRLERFEEGSGILPHERTMPGPVEDRLALLRACPVNISPIYAIYRGAGSLEPYYDSLLHRPTDARFTDEHGALHRMWSIRAQGELDMLAATLRDGPLVLADGHHRYETALAYRDLRAGAPGHHDAVMCLCVDADCEGIEVLSYNRLLRSSMPAPEISERLLRRFPCKSLARGEGGAALAESSSEHALLFVLPQEEVLVEVAHHDVVARVGERPPAWSALDAVALHETVLPEVFPEGLTEVGFSSDADRVAALVRDGAWSGGVILRPLRPDSIIAVALSGERMPQKTSYFSPKAVTGLVFRSLV